MCRYMYLYVCEGLNSANKNRPSHEPPSTHSLVVSGISSVERAESVAETRSLSPSPWLRRNTELSLERDHEDITT